MIVPGLVSDWRRRGGTAFAEQSAACCVSSFCGEGADWGPNLRVSVRISEGQDLASGFSFPDILVRFSFPVFLLQGNTLA